MTLTRLLMTASILLCAAGLNGCQTTTAGGSVGADRSQLMLISSEELERMSAEEYEKMKSEAGTAEKLNTDTAMVQRIRAIASRIQPQTRIFREDAPGWQWEVNVLSSEDLNAFCMPGGKIMFYSGIVSKLELTDAEIAMIMGHEIAHALREHAREQISQSMAAQTAIGIGASLLGLGQGASSVANTGYSALIATRFSRSDESEADRIGLELAARAGYDPRAGISLWQKMSNANQNGRPPEFLSTHPAEKSRVQQIEGLLPTVLPLYEATQ